ncbi:transcriptional regulator family: Fungal Specific TF [Penicillium chermesinum]|uniref:Transcriptional regulator family: Fungal Specific TF n=1 Tax=Penicillium chermesinum TaxID=63820 RepID=A0A9W9TYX5_9EURO|nr:transcriptional regulator family: Fungal Specific TF [Penicillium chermesinum]KAJ5248585.1 transcriptional regulator family: Fungal Specific TF [Penicillium chermesinum]KAJ6150700.1 transcriptional regulator family: Fungal Specific TF [Penicillium chermesinum]
MNTIRQKRQSCEACRARKLRCSGDKGGCSRCRGLSLVCRYQDKGAPGRPRKRPRQEQDDRDLSPQDQRTSSSSSNFSPVAPLDEISPHDAVHMFLGPDEFGSLPFDPSGHCGFDALPPGMLGHGDICSFPIELLQATRGNEIHDPEIPLALEACISPASSSPICKCDEDVSATVRSLARATMSHSFIQSLRSGVALTERLLTCPICYDTSKPPRVTVQNVLLIGRLMFEITSGYQKYIQWLNKHCTELDVRSRSETIYLDPGYGLPPDLDLQISGEKFRDLVMHGLQTDAERLLVLGKKFAQRQRNRHMVGHETCPDAEGRCRREQYGGDHDPLDLCPQDPAARKLVPCFRIVDEVRGMIKQVADSVV